MVDDGGGGITTGLWKTNIAATTKIESVAKSYRNNEFPDFRINVYREEVKIIIVVESNIHPIPSDIR